MSDFVVKLMIVLIFFKFLSLLFLGTTTGRSKSVDSKKSRRINYKAKKFPFRYSESGESHDFLVYMIENKKLNSIKVGVGSQGRLNQLLYARESPNLESEFVGWSILRLARFSSGIHDFEIGKKSAYEAEKRAHYYWRNVLGVDQHLEVHQMGYCTVIIYGKEQWIPTQGYTETAQLNNICEVSTWNFIKKSPGFIDEVHPSTTRDLILRDEKSSDLDLPSDYGEKKSNQVNHSSKQRKIHVANMTKEDSERFWNKVRKSETCWYWLGARIDSGYGIAVINGKNIMAHRVSWTLELNSELGLFLLENKCGTKHCVRTDHWELSQRRRSEPGEIRVSQFNCATPECTRPALTMTKIGLCEPCKQKAKKQKREARLRISDKDSHGPNYPFT